MILVLDLFWHFFTIQKLALQLFATLLFCDTGVVEYMYLVSFFDEKKLAYYQYYIVVPVPFDLKDQGVFRHVAANIFSGIFIQGINGSEHGKVDLKEKLDQRAKRFNTENLGTEVRPKANTRDIERLSLSFVLQTPSKSFRHYRYFQV